MLKLITVRIMRQLSCSNINMHSQDFLPWGEGGTCGSGFISVLVSRGGMIWYRA